MKFYKGKVDSLKDSTKSGTISVNLQGAFERSVPVSYTSPSYSNFEGGLFCPPRHGDEVMVVYDESLGTYYYLSTLIGSNILTNPEKSVARKKDTPILNERFSYNKDNIPSMVTLTNTDGQGLRIYNYLDGKGGAYIKKTVVGESPVGNRLELDNSPDKDGILLINKHGDSIRITSDETSQHAQRCIAINAEHSITANATTGDIRVELGEGRDITIKNNSAGVNGGFDIPLPGGIGTFNPIPAGNLNLVTKYRDVNIYTEEIPNSVTKYAGRILISTPQGKIQLKCGSDGITLYSEGHINIASIISPKTVVVDTLSSFIDEVLGETFPNITGKVVSFTVQPGQIIQSGNTLAVIEVKYNKDINQFVNIISPYTARLVTKLAPEGSVVTLFQPLALLETDGGDINLLADRNINLQAPLGAINLFASNIKSTSILDTTIGSTTLGVSVAGPKFTLGTAASNIIPANSGGAIYTSEVVPIVPPAPLEAGALLPIIPDVGAYFVGKQP